MDFIKSRVLQYAKVKNSDLPAFTRLIFGSQSFFQSDEQITVQQIVDLAAMCSDLNMNWIINGRGKMLYSTDEILIEALEEEIILQQRELNKLKLFENR